MIFFRFVQDVILPLNMSINAFASVVVKSCLGTNTAEQKSLNGYRIHNLFNCYTPYFFLIASLCSGGSCSSLIFVLNFSKMHSSSVLKNGQALPSQNFTVRTLHLNFPFFESYAKQFSKAHHSLSKIFRVLQDDLKHLQCCSLYSSSALKRVNSSPYPLTQKILNPLV